MVVDTDVYGASLVPGSKLAERYEPVILGRPVFISFQTVAELRYGATLRGWGSTRMRKLDAKINNTEIVHTGPNLIEVYVQLRVDCKRSGHGLADRAHDADRWIAATAMRLGFPLVSNDGIFDQVPGLALLTA